MKHESGKEVKSYEQKINDYGSIFDTYNFKDGTHFIQITLKDGSWVKQYFNDKNEHHREDGSAIEYSNECKYWYKENKFHRLNGPAIEYSSGIKYWYIENKKYTEEEFNAKIAEMNKPKTVKSAEMILFEDDKVKIIIQYK